MHASLFHQPLKIPKWPHFVIFKGLFPNIQPHFQHRDIGIFMSLRPTYILHFTNACYFSHHTCLPVRFSKLANCLQNIRGVYPKRLVIIAQTIQLAYIPSLCVMRTCGFLASFLQIFTQEGTLDMATFNLGLVWGFKQNTMGFKQN